MTPARIAELRQVVFYDEDRDEMLDEIERLRALAADPIFPFLLGEGALDIPEGTLADHGDTSAWFSESVRPSFWWRTRLRSVVAEILDGTS